MTWFAIAIGGALGAVARHGVNHLVHVRWLTTRLPIGTVVVNLAGCLAIGLLAGLLASERLALRGHWREFVFVGLLGGFTTFSTFGLDTFLLTRTHSAGGMSRALLKLSGSLVHDYATISDDSPSPNRASRARRAATSAGIS